MRLLHDYRPANIVRPVSRKKETEKKATHRGYWQAPIHQGSFYCNQMT